MYTCRGHEPQPDGACSDEHPMYRTFNPDIYIKPAHCVLQPLLTCTLKCLVEVARLVGYLQVENAVNDVHDAHLRKCREINEEKKGDLVREVV